ncbi:M23 family metallopeptidase [Streptomyces sp. NBC_00572]|uniref:M23 family metallopeptidase n=1 Tax=Streptomyces sp. NBC_00572 TaxID=2903664 RepID=UPI002254B3F3|nr:M23 family metallopeptidase [Streptomyces sp. NBC_00572]MCX4984924.1 M23 family metallopeptidase [Streptomyces sp. NBC_00572]
MKRTVNTPAFTTPAFTDAIPADCACAGCADAARPTGAGGPRAVAPLHGVRRAVVATVGAVALAGAGAGTAAAEPAPAHAGWDGSKYWFRNAAGEWRWTSHATTYEQRTGASAATSPAGGGRTGEPVFRGRQGWDAQDRVYWYKSLGHWYWTGHAWKYQQRTGLSGDTSNSTRPSGPSGPTAPSGSSRGWTTPVSSYVYTGWYGQRGSWSKGYHTGQDFAVPTGTTVRSVGPGRVVTAGYGRSYGYEVVIRHPDGRFTQYAHLSRIDVSPGQSVSAGQRIARSGATGRVTGPHLHFEVRTTPYFGSDINPLAYLRGHGVP